MGGATFDKDERQRSVVRRAWGLRDGSSRRAKKQIRIVKSRTPELINRSRAANYAECEWRPWLGARPGRIGPTRVRRRVLCFERMRSGNRAGNQEFGRHHCTPPKLRGPYPKTSRAANDAVKHGGCHTPKLLGPPTTRHTVAPLQNGCRIHRCGRGIA